MSIPADFPKVVIFDLDGTLVSTRSGKTFWRTPDDWYLRPCVAAAVERLRGAGIHVGVATNQGGVGFGIKTEDEARRYVMSVTRALHLVFYALCFSHPKATVDQYRVADDPLRKPNPGMLLHVLEHFGVAPADALYVGDMDTDIEAAQRAGCAYLSEDTFFTWMSLDNLDRIAQTMRDHRGGRAVVEGGHAMTPDGQHNLQDAMLINAAKALMEDILRGAICFRDGEVVRKGVTIHYSAECAYCPRIYTHEEVLNLLDDNDPLRLAFPHSSLCVASRAVAWIKQFRGEEPIISPPNDRDEEGL